MTPYNPALANVALANLDRFEKSAVIPADASGVIPIEPGGEQPGMPPGGEMPPPGAAGAGPMPPGAGVGPPMPPGAGGGPPLPPDAGGAPPVGGGSAEEQLASLNAKMDQLSGMVQGFLMGQESAGGSKGSGGGGNGAKDQLALLPQIASALGIQSGADPAQAGAAPGVPPMPAGGIGIGAVPGMPGTAGPGPDLSGSGMTASASDESADAGSHADRIANVVKRFRR